MMASFSSLNLYAKEFQPTAQSSNHVEIQSFLFSYQDISMVENNTLQAESIEDQTFYPLVESNFLENWRREEDKDQRHLFNCHNDIKNITFLNQYGYQNNTNHEDKSQMSQIPERYWKLSIQYGKWGNPTTNFHRFNRTGFCGLQGDQSNSYCNALIQILYFEESIRELALVHACDTDKCLVCELSFLFQMMDQSPGLLCQPANLLRSLRTNPEAFAQGLVLPDEFVSVSNFQMSAMVQAWQRFALAQFDQLMGNNSAFDQMWKVQAVEVTKCSHCHGCLGVRKDVKIGCDLIYPTLAKEENFEDVLCASLNISSEDPMWCGRCRQFQVAKQTRQLQALPSSLFVNTGLDQPRNLEFWRKHCHPVIGHVKEDEEPMRAQSWIPQRITLRRLTNGDLRGGATDLEASEHLLEVADFELQSASFVISDPGTGQALNVVAAINVGTFYHARVGSPVSQWYCFNDFGIEPINIAEVIGGTDLDWKIPTTLVYGRVNHQAPSFSNPKSPSHCPIDFDIFCPSRGQGIPTTFLPLEANEIPSSGDLVALDAEFVTLRPEVKSIGDDRQSIITRGAQRAVARVTCIRGQGPLYGMPFVDDFISCEEEISDYVTKYSGIYPGDLDLHTSSKYLTTLKTTYKKILFLANAGCIFVGHGLKSDFAMLNIVVPPEQIVDTVHLFHLPNRRNLSLRFLAWYFLGKIIQSGNHDSTEDAMTALELYQVFREFEAKKEDVGKVLECLYEQAKICGWTVPEQGHSC